MFAKLTLASLDRFRDHGLLLLRVGLGLMFVGHGWPKLIGGPEKWTKLGAAMGNLGLDVAPAFWGLLAALAEAGGGALLALGLLTRPALIALSFTMMVAALKHGLAGHGFGKTSHAVEAGITFVALLLIGPGRFSLDERLLVRRDS